MTKPTLRTLRKEIDFYNLRKEQVRVAEDVNFYLNVRNEFIRAAQLNPSWDQEQLGKMVFEAFKVTEEFMDFYANEHLRAINDQIISRSA